MKKSLVYFIFCLFFTTFTSNAFSEKLTYKFDNLTFSKLQKQEIPLYSTPVAAKQTEPLTEKQKFMHFFSAGDVGLQGVTLHSDTKNSYFFIAFSPDFSVLFWNGTPFLDDLTNFKRLKQEYKDALPGIIIPVTGKKGELTVSFRCMMSKKNPKDGVQQIGAFNENKELIDLKFVDLINKESEQSLKFEIPEGTQSVTLYMSQNRKAEDPKIMIGMGIQKITFKEK